MPRGGDPYLLPNGTLRNKLGVSSQEKLDDQERDLAAARERFLLARLPGPPFTFETLKGFHRELFQDVYEWAGQPRTAPIGKPEYDRPGSPVRWFTDPGEIGGRANAAFDDLAARNFLAGTTRAEFARGAADVLAAVDKAHAFREGNGRSQRLLLTAIARNAGHELAFDVVSKERMVAVSIAAYDGDLSGMLRMFDEILDPRQVGAMRKAIGYLDRAGFKWNDVYVSTTRAGQDYSGVLVGRAGSDFMLRADPRRGPGSAEPRGSILVGDAADLAPDAKSGERLSVRAAHFAPPADHPPAQAPARTASPGRSPAEDIVAALRSPPADAPWDAAPTPFRDRLAAFEARKAEEAARKAAPDPGKDASASPEPEQSPAPPKPSGGPGPGF